MTLYDPTLSVLAQVEEILQTYEVLMRPAAASGDGVQVSLAEVEEALAVWVGLGRIVALYYCSSTLYQIY